MAIRLTAADEFRAVAARYQKRVNGTAKPALRDAYRQLTLGYMRLALQQEAIERCHAAIGRLDCDDIVMDPLPVSTARYSKRISRPLDERLDVTLDARRQRGIQQEAE